MLGTTAGVPSLEGDGGNADQSSQVRAVVSYFGVTDLAQLYRSNVNDKAPFLTRMASKLYLEQFLGGPLDKRADAYTKASPITYAGKDTAPTLLLQGTADQVVPLEQAQLFQKKLKGLGVDVGLVTLEDAPHSFSGEPEALADAAALAFLDRHLKDEPLRARAGRGK
jgi:dipeptidyl aminopeptidase/acylaminoacyl peptidase